MSDNLPPLEQLTERLVGAEAERSDSYTHTRALGPHQPTASALDSISEGFLILDRDWRFVFANSAAEGFTHKSRAELIGQNLWELFPEANHRRFGLEYRRAVADNVPVHFEEFYPEPLNKWYEVRAYPSAEGLSIFFRDVTERRRIENALRERIKELDCLYAIADLIGNEDDLGRILQGTVELIPRGWLHSEIACARIILDEQEFKTANFRVAKEKQAADIILHGKPVGRVEVGYLEERPIRDEGPFLKEERNLINAIAERLGRVVERIRIAGELERTRTEAVRERKRLEAIMDALPPVAIIDAEGRVMRSNTAYDRAWGAGCPTILPMTDLHADREVPLEVSASAGAERRGRADRPADLTPHDVGHAMADTGRRCGTMPCEVAERVVEVQRHDGSRAYVLDSAAPILDDNGQLTGCAVAIQDITERIEMERALARSQAALQRVNDQLQAANDALRRTNETLETRVAARTADLSQRTAQLQALARDLAQAEEHERQRVAEVIHDELQQLLSVARINLGMVLGQVKARSIKEGLSGADRLIAESLEITRSLTAELSPAILRRSGLAAALRWLGRSYADRFALNVLVEAEDNADVDEETRVTLFRCVRELLFNVVKHARVTSARVGLSRAADSRLLIVVSDHGVGFDPETLRARDGTGKSFGLLSLRERLELLGGALDVASAPGRGTSVTILAPVHQGARPQASAPAPRRGLVRPDDAWAAGTRGRGRSRAKGDGGPVE